MNYREVFLLNEEVLADSGTKTIDINVVDPITEILINFKVKNTTSAVDDTPAQEVIDKIELVDGGQVYMSMTGEEAVAVAAYNLGRYPGCWMDEGANAEQRCFIPIHFGRFFGDTEFGLDLDRLINPQLKITYAKDDDHVTNMNTLEIMATLMQGAGRPPKCLCVKTVESWITAAEGVHPIDMPVDRPWRRLFARTYEDGVWIGNQWAKFKLDCDLGQLIVFDWEDVHFLRYVQAHFPLIHATGFVAATYNELKQSRLGQVESGGLMASDPTGSIAFGIPTSPHYVRLYVTDHEGLALTDKKCRLDVAGWLPENTYCYQFGDPKEVASWFNAPAFKGIKFNITESDAGGAASVLLEQPVTLGAR